MSFGHPESWWLLPAVGLLSFWMARERTRRIRSWRMLAQRGKPSGQGTASLVIALLLLVAALARPRFGPELRPPLPPGQDLVILMDVSLSMGAEDAVPHRLAAATQAARTLVEAMGADPSNRIGIAAFAGRGVLRYPLTDNLGAVVDVLNRLSPGSVQPGGTDIGAALDAALDAFGSDQPAEGRVIVIFSDGEDLAGHWQSRLGRLAQMGVIVHAVTIGDADEGHPVPAVPGKGSLTYEGQPVRSRRVDEILETIAQQSGGAVIRLGLAAADLGTLYRERIAPAARRHREATRTPDRPEQFPLFLAASLGFLITGWWSTDRRRRWRWNRDWKGAVLPFGILAIGCLSAAAPSLSGDDEISVPDLVARGRAEYAAGRWTEALAAFEQAARNGGDQAVLRYNSAATLFQLGQYADALAGYGIARRSAGPALRTKIDFAMGNCELLLGNLDFAVEHYDRCLGSTASGEELDRVRNDAELNRRFAIQQAASSMGARGDDAGDKSPQDPRRRQSQKQDPGTDGDSEDQQNVGAAPESGGAQPQGPGETRRRSSRRRTGGGGGAGSKAPNSGGTPDERLDAALDEIREAQGRRLSESSAAEPSGDTRKDW